MVDEMLVAQEEWLPQYGEAIAKAKARLEAGRAAGTLIPHRDYQGAARLKVKTVEEMARDREAASRNAAAADKGQDREKGNA